MINEPFAWMPWLSKEECVRVHTIAMSHPPTAGKAYDTPEGYRVCELRQFHDEWLNGLLWTFFGRAGRVFGVDIDGMREPFQFVSYSAADGGHYGWHVDRGARIPRKLSLTVQLSDTDAYEGGALEIWSGAEPVTAPRYLGSAICFPSYALHRVTPVTRGERCALMVWAHGPEFR